MNLHRLLGVLERIAAALEALEAGVAGLQEAITDAGHEVAAALAPEPPP